MTCTAQTLKLGLSVVRPRILNFMFEAAVLVLAVSVVVCVILQLCLAIEMIHDGSLKLLESLLSHTFLSGFEKPITITVLTLDALAILALGVANLCEIGSEELEKSTKQAASEAPQA